MTLLVSFVTVDNVAFTVTDQTDLQACQILLQGQRCSLVGRQQDQEGHHATDLKNRYINHHFMTVMTH